ncbi:Sfi1 spindle body protein-domain-containing protein [Cladorrhinum samala]|uniref:Sfi1 spindle body protein-domain-containing protein n=1 Tax=Cladorrhinum samala TaxID=585594 RepID=A0AAV9HGV0_9PEZI|nr:Sfi1 spindle body protein-domain-containing protein [Cladorrhinum samala]
MPPQSSLPLRDGRAGVPFSSSSFIHNSQLSDPYTDEDIELIHEIVALGESIYPTLPERERLPTNALFLAAEQILPAHDYDAENAPSHISRLIFKIGGQRSGETLSDKFRTVLEGMGIKLEFVPSSPPIRSGSHRLYPISDEETVEFDFDDKRRPRPRHSAIPRRVGRVSLSDEATYDLPVRTYSRPRSRSVSFLDDQVTAHTDEETRPFSRGERQDLAQFMSKPQAIPKPVQQAVGDDQPAARRLRRKPSRVWNWQLQIEKAEKEDAGADDGKARFESHIPAHLLAYPEKNKPDRAKLALHTIGPNRENAAGAENGNNKDRVSTATPSTIADTEPIGNSHGSDGFNGARGSSDTTVEPHDKYDDQNAVLPHGERSAVDFEALEAKMEQIRAAEDVGLLEDAFDEWLLRSRHARTVNTDIMDTAAELADSDIVDECLEIWREEAVLLVRAQAMARATAEQEAYVARMERRAARVYEIFTVTSALLFWHQEALEEVERTAAARRHLVRKRAFEAWRAQRVEDEAKVANFQLIHWLQTWTQVAFHQEVRRNVAIQRDQQVLSRQSLDAMWQIQKARAADNFQISWLLRNAVETWITVDNESVQQEELAVELDERLLLDEALTIWNEEAIEIRLNADQLTIEYFRQDARRIMQDWQEQARLTSSLAQFRRAADDDEKNRVLGTWHTSLEETTNLKTAADNFVLANPLVIWRREALLREFQANQQYDLLAGVLSFWSLQQRELEFKRQQETQTLIQTLDSFRLAAVAARHARWDGEEESLNLFEYNTYHDVFDDWLDELDQSAFWRHRQNADLICLYRSTRHLIDHWQLREREAVTRRRQADISARRRIAETVLDVWPEVTEAARRQRLMSSLRAFRRHYKVQTARSCLDHWHLAATDYVEFGRDAHNVNIHFRRADINEYLDYWADTAHRAKEVHGLAAEAELELWFGKWADEARELAATREYAVEYDEDVVLWRCWERWEFEALQVVSRNQMVGAVRERNNGRLCRQLLDEWYIKTVPVDGNNVMRLGGATTSDFRASLLGSRRSVRSGIRGGGSILGTPLPIRNRGGGSVVPPPPPPPETPRFVSVSQLGRGANTNGNEDNGGEETFRPAHQFSTSLRSRLGLTGGGAGAKDTGDSLLGAMPEFDDDSFAPDAETNDPGFMSTPTKWTGSARPLGYRPAAAAGSNSTPFNKATTTPSAILASPYERELRNGYSVGTGGERSSLGLKLRGSLLGRSTANRTRTVEFADITEDSAEASSRLSFLQRPKKKRGEREESPA